MSKGRKEHQPVSIFWPIALLVVSIFLLADARAQDNAFQSNDMNTVGGDINDDTVAIGFSSPSFGVAISQCVATEARNFAFGAYGHQKITVNYWCMGSSLYQMGKYNAAAMVWCSKTDLGDLYTDPDSCIDDLSEAPETPVAAPVVVDKDMHTEELEQYAMLIDDLNEKYDDLAAFEPIEKTIVQQVEVPALSEAQRAAFIAEFKQ